MSPPPGSGHNRLPQIKDDPAKCGRSNLFLPLDVYSVLVDAGRLLVGEGNFSFAAALATTLGNIRLFGFSYVFLHQVL